VVFDLAPPEEDGLHKEEVGPWAADKHHFLRRYIDAFTTAMKDKGWKGLHYIDLFAGPGILQIKDGPLDWGSPLIAAQAPNQFARLHLCELKKRNFEALSARVARFDQPNAPQLLHGDANKAVEQVAAEIPPGALSLAFLDPHGLHLNFETLSVLSQRRADLIIFFPDYLDAVRNWQVYETQDDSNLDQVLGTRAWRKQMSQAHPDRRAEVFGSIYRQQIAKLGYTDFADERIAHPNGAFLYKLVFCSRHPTGGAIWRRIAKKKRDGQGELFE